MSELKFDLKQTLKNTPRPPQHQGSLQEQVEELKILAVHFGLYDADEYLKRVFGQRGVPTRQY